MFVEFAGSAGVGKSTISRMALHVLSERIHGVDFLPSPVLGRLATSMHVARHPHLVRTVRHLRACHPDRERPVARNWAPQVAAADISMRLAQRRSTVVVSQEVLFHWLKKFPAETQLHLAHAGLPLPDLLVLLVTTPAERLRREVTRRRSINGIDQLPQSEVERIARSTATDLLRSFPVEECARTLLEWGSNRAADRLSASRLGAILEEEARRCPGIDPDRHRLETKQWIRESAARFGIPLVQVDDLGTGTPVAVATEAAEKILAHAAVDRSADWVDIRS